MNTQKIKEIMQNNLEIYNYDPILVSVSEYTEGELKKMIKIAREINKLADENKVYTGTVTPAVDYLALLIREGHLLTVAINCG